MLGKYYVLRETYIMDRLIVIFFAAVNKKYFPVGHRVLQTQTCCSSSQHKLMKPPNHCNWRVEIN